ncbi:lectin-like domain-containing protein [Levilactobacillus zymae]|uniref:lectin-like domain-containing protein n=1 Tax=Levilactobacillus zymae TaxID=267363 RepID=UPI0028B8E186|nr:hypothetical protein [Levilactobacillus zymae]MDT6980260.1 hypothetical protein [Levilactobacillus zymae]
MKLRWYWGVLLGLSVVLLGLSVVLSGMSTGQAKGKQPYNYKEDYKKALRTAPQGILVKDIFERGDPQDNQAAVVPVTNDEVKATTEAVMITNDKNQYGTIWSTAANKFKLKHDRVASMWMYFGGNRGAAADGMALVLQNDQRRGNAKSVYRDHPFGEPLGVWGVDDDKELRDAQGLAKRAIQNSWALEFDTHLNNSDNLRSAGTADSFDIGLKGPHIAAAYPGEASSYQQHSGVRYNMDRVFYYHLVHQKPIDQLSLADGQWHHVTLSWQAADPEDPQRALPQMTYTFDDKDPETNVERPGYTRTVPVDPKIIDPTGSGETMWGFTGATGEAAANNLVIFEGVPGLVDISAHTELTNLTTNQVVRDGDRLKNGDRVRLQYQLTYQGASFPGSR